jgi:hypothetical protein
LSCF